MLVLTRKLGETIHINDNIQITVVALEGGKVRLGITAPPEVSILRSELLAEPVVVGGDTEAATPRRPRAPIARNRSLPRLPR